MTPKPVLDAPTSVGSWSDEVEDQLHEELMTRGEPFPEMTDLTSEALEIENIIQQEEKTPKHSKFPRSVKSTDEDEIVNLIENAQSIKTSTKKEPQISKKPTIEPKQAPFHDESEADHYQESFTSQEETAELRNHIDSLDTRLSSIEEMINAIMLERSNLPNHLDRHREEINKQFTIISDRLHTALEQNIDHTAVAQTAKDVSVLSADANHTLGTLTTELTKEPKAGSATASNVPITRKPRRVRVVE